MLTLCGLLRVPASRAVCYKSGLKTLQNPATLGPLTLYFNTTCFFGGKCMFCKINLISKLINKSKTLVFVNENIQPACYIYLTVTLLTLHILA